MSGEIKKTDNYEANLNHSINCNTRIAWVLVWTGIVLAAIGLCFVLTDKDHFTLSNLALYGSYLQGAVGSVWALAGFLLIYVAFRGQQLQILKQDNELAAQEKQFKSQQESIKRQNFESSFFQLLGQHQQIVANLRDHINFPAEGRDCFERWYKRFSEQFSVAQFANEMITPGSVPKAVFQLDYAKETYAAFYKKHQAVLGHYFRNLYHIFKFVDINDVPKINDKTSDLENKRRYTSLARAQLSQYELALLFYNAITPIPPEKTNKFKHLIEEYGLLENFNDANLINKEHRQFYADSAYADSTRGVQ